MNVFAFFVQSNGCKRMCKTRRYEDIKVWALKDSKRRALILRIVRALEKCVLLVLLSLTCTLLFSRVGGVFSFCILLVQYLQKHKESVCKGGL